MSMEWEDAGEFCQCVGGKKGQITIQSVLGQSRLNTFSQRVKHKVNTGNLMNTEVAFVERFENSTNEWCFVWLQRWKEATPAGQIQRPKKEKNLYRGGCFSSKGVFLMSMFVSVWGREQHTVKVRQFQWNWLTWSPVLLSSTKLVTKYCRQQTFVMWFFTFSRSFVRLV